MFLPLFLFLFLFFELCCNWSHQDSEITDTYPEFDQEEGWRWTFVVQLFQTSLLFRKFVVDLTDVYGLSRKIRNVCNDYD